MNKFIVATDSGCDLSIDICRDNDIRTLFMEYEKNGKVFPDTMEVADLKSFYNSMASGDVVHTSAISIGAYISFWESLLGENKPIVQIILGSAISCSYSNSLLALEEFKKDHPDAEIYLVDSTVASTGYGLMALEAAAMRDDGMTAKECAEALENFKKNVHAVFTTGDLTYLYRGGRVKKTSMVIAHALGILPILHLNEPGELKVIDKVRGRRAAYKNMLEKIRARVVNPEEQILYISHSDFAAEATAFGTMAKEEFGFKDVVYCYIGSIIGAHTGPGLIAVFFKGIKRSDG